MTSYFNRRRFIKLTATVAAGGPIFCSRPGRIRAAESAGTRVTVWEGPGGDVAASPDYEVTVISGGRSWRPFTYYSYNRPVDKLLDREGKYLKLGFLALHSNEFKRPEDNRDTYAHSWTHFDFSGGPIEVEVKIRRPLDGLTLPLESCGIFPSTLGIQGEVVASDTIRLTLDRPAIIAIVPNHREALEKLKTADPKQAFEGYRNPLFLFARASETDAPDRNAPGTLVIKPGQARGVEDFARAKRIYFEPGVHDYSQFNPADPDHYITLQTGQTMFLAGGAYVYGVVNFDKRGPISEMPLLCGRGTLSGIKQRWTDVPYRTTVERNVRMEGIQIADPHNHISHSCSPVKDLAVVGAWHGNTDGLTREVPKWETYQGWHIDDCFVMAADSNLKVGGPARVRDYTAWQLGNAEPFWIRNPDGCIVDGVQVIAYHNPAGRQTINISRGTLKNSVFRNILIEAPFVPLLFLMPVSNSEGSPAYENVLFENVIVNTPHIAEKSPFGAAQEGVQIGKVVFRNLVINGVKVTGKNCRDYFELLKGVTVGKEIVFE
ncbi:MAG: hypothetical protein FJ276_03305 [Planctomycetes bacterium]|nr:hypothetical protein [Planctomycetota bacterium]